MRGKSGPSNSGKIGEFLPGERGSCLPKPRSRLFELPKPSSIWTSSGEAAVFIGKDEPIVRWSREVNL